MLGCWEARRLGGRAKRYSALRHPDEIEFRMTEWKPGGCQNSPWQAIRQTALAGLKPCATLQFEFVGLVAIIPDRVELAGYNTGCLGKEPKKYPVNPVK